MVQNSHVSVACSSVDMYGTVMHTYSNTKFLCCTCHGLPLHFFFCCFSASFCSVVVQHDTEFLTGCVQHDIQIKLLKSNREGQFCCFLIYEERPKITLLLLMFSFTFCAKDAWFAMITDQKTQWPWDSNGWILDRKWYFYINTSYEPNFFMFSLLMVSHNPPGSVQSTEELHKWNCKNRECQKTLLNESHLELLQWNTSISLD